MEGQVRDHHYLHALEAGQVSTENLKAFAGEQYNIIRSDLPSEAQMVNRFGAMPSGALLREIMDAEAQGNCSPCLGERLHG
jgi:hypothetical protein